MSVYWSANLDRDFPAGTSCKICKTELGLASVINQRGGGGRGTPVALHWKRGLLQRRMMGSRYRVGRQTTQICSWLVCSFQVEFSDQLSPHKIKSDGGPRRSSGWPSPLPLHSGCNFGVRSVRCVRQRRSGGNKIYERASRNWN